MPRDHAQVRNATDGSAPYKLTDGMRMCDPHIMHYRGRSATCPPARALNGEHRFVFYSLQGRSRISNNTMLHTLYRTGYKSRMTGHGSHGLAATSA
jgi:hypothetical protein